MFGENFSTPVVVCLCVCVVPLCAHVCCVGGGQTSVFDREQHETGLFFRCHKICSYFTILKC